ncbi:hypothetical protein 2.41 [Burkholderia phage Bups phi1]|nr:hypothetical protein 2.41 [Burkholderia phage Bups phi1]
MAGSSSAATAHTNSPGRRSRFPTGWTERDGTSNDVARASAHRVVVAAIRPIPGRLVPAHAHRTGLRANPRRHCARRPIQHRTLNVQQSRALRSSRAKPVRPD